ncbi:unnamed protein product [Mesocestoides corti]|uniref:Sialidase n=1 Tax=Mesocestoides corti TaxID=53468 RepID=A0A0R3UB13_MESCO|nr:unnamed protein product [Mesocestoides corti]
MVFYFHNGERFATPSLTAKRSVDSAIDEKRWGTVPWFHEVDRAEVTGRVSAGLLVILTSHARRSVKQKSAPSPSL